MNLSNLDIFLIFIYFIVLLLIGYFSSRNQKEEDYLIAERKIGAWSTMATVNASQTGSFLMIFVAMVYLWGFAAVWYFIGAIIGYLLFIPFALRLKKRSTEKYYTLAHYFKINYGKKVAIFASIISIFLMFGFSIINLIAASKIFVYFTGWSFWLCVILMAFVIMVYLLLGGFKAVVKTDILQYAAMIFILAILAVILFHGSLASIPELNIFDIDFITISGFILIGIIWPFASPDLWQRVYSSGSKKHLKRGLILSIVFYSIMALFLTLIALAVKAYFPTIEPDIALIYGFANLLPKGLVGISMILLFTAIMSSLDTYVFTASSSAIQDFFDWDPKKYVRSIRKVIFLVLFLATLIAILIKSLIISTYIFAAFYIILAIPILGTWIRKDVNQRTLIWSFIFGIFGVLIKLIIDLSAGEIDPMIVIIAIFSSLFGLFISGTYSYFKK